MNLLSIENISKTVNEKPLFQNVTMGIDEGEKIGFIGPNGTGKSTLLHIIANLNTADEGKISRNNKLRISMLEQNPAIKEGISIREFLYYGETPVIKLIKEYQSCLEETKHSNSSKGEEYNLHQLELLTEKMEQENGWAVENNYLSFLSEFKIDFPDEKMENLSGGMKKKVAIARALASMPNLLILDEPTNHLDIEIIEWLEKYLGSANFSFIMVTHDRYFLDSVCSSILELDRGKIFKYPGNYTTFLERREIRLSTERNEQAKIKSILRRELEWLSRGPKARASKDKKRKMRIETLIDKKVREEDKSNDFSSAEKRLGKKIVELKNITKSYNDNVIIAPFSYKFKRGERIGIIGPNGSGKTTVLDLLTKKVTPDSGEIETGINTEIGYYDQLSDNLTRAAEKQMTVIEYIKERGEQIKNSDKTSVSASQFLETFNFPSNMHRTLLEKLSGGEKRRLYLIKILTQNPNFLILDEPTNDLDLDTMRQLEEFILNFRGTIIIVSHDRAFLDRTTDSLFIFQGDGNIKEFSGNYSEYRDFFKTNKESRVKKEKNNSAEKKTEIPSDIKSKRKLTYKENKEFNDLEEEIDLLEKEKSSLELLFSDNSLTHEAISDNNKRYKEITEEIDLKLSRWEELAEIGE